MKRFLPFLLIMAFCSCNINRGNPASKIVKKVKDCCSGLVIQQQVINPESGVSSLSTNINPVFTTTVMEKTVQTLTW